MSPLCSRWECVTRGPFYSSALVGAVLLLHATSCSHQYYTYKSKSQSHEMWSEIHPPKACVPAFGTVSAKATCGLPFISQANAPTWLTIPMRHLQEAPECSPLRFFAARAADVRSSTDWTQEPQHCVKLPTLLFLAHQSIYVSPNASGNRNSQAWHMFLQTPTGFHF